MRVNHPFIAPPSCKAYPIAIPLHDYCAIYNPPTNPLVYAIHHTTLAIAISCKGQAWGVPYVSTLAAWVGTSIPLGLYTG